MTTPVDQHRQFIAAQLTIAAMQNYQAAEGERFILDRVPFVVQAYEAIYEKLEATDRRAEVTLS
ncbi:MAG: hypothetical protein ACK46X_09240 [Candidatus Sericytochromatia bacterium]